MQWVRGKRPAGDALPPLRGAVSRCNGTEESVGYRREDSNGARYLLPHLVFARHRLGHSAAGCCRFAPPPRLRGLRLLVTRHEGRRLVSSGPGLDGQDYQAASGGCSSGCRALPATPSEWLWLRCPWDRRRPPLPPLGRYALAQSLSPRTADGAGFWARRLARPVVCLRKSGPPNGRLLLEPAEKVCGRADLPGEALALGPGEAQPHGRRVMAREPLGALSARGVPRNRPAVRES
jgi:hypothetical protein